MAMGCPAYNISPSVSNGRSGWILPYIRFFMPSGKFDAVGWIIENIEKKLTGKESYH